MPFHLYLHLPYCRRRCPYCDFYKKVPQPGQLRSFTKALCAELELASAALPWTQSPLHTIYFGGGTPSLHSPEELQQVIAKVRSLWSLEPDAEITLETNPGTVDAPQLGHLGAIGINRLSIGAQSFSQRKLDLLYRDHTLNEIYSCVDASQKAGFENISLDLIFGLPGETVSEWTHDIESALALNPQHISLYNLEFHEHTPFYRWKKQGKLIPLATDFEADLYLLTHDILTRAGYEHYEVSNFAKPGFRSRHNCAYWLGSPYLGCGPSAHSFDGKTTRFKNISSDTIWEAHITQGALAHEAPLRLSAREHIEEWISLALRRDEGIDRNAAVGLLGSESTNLLWQLAAGLPGSTRTVTDTNFRLTPSGWFQENSILAHLFSLLP